jgi:hypothetical protein
MAVSVGQITIMDYNDALTLTGFITSNLPKTQRYSADTGTYTPDWGATSLVLTPSLFILGSGSDKITDSAVLSVTWQRKPSDQSTFAALSTGEAVSGTKNHILSVSSNKLTGSISAIEYLCTVIYHDNATGLDLTYKMSINLSKVIDGNNIAVAAVHAPNGNVFKNSAPNSLSAKAELYRGATLDTTLLSYQWFKYAPGNPDEGAGADWDLITGEASSSLTVTPSMVAGLQQFKVKITDNDAASPTNGDSFFDVIAFTDMTDPIQVVIESTAGTVFKNGVGTTDLSAKLFRNGEEIDAAGTDYTYTWSITDKNGSARTFADASSSKIGKTISVGTSDVDVKSTITCSVS